MISRIVIMLLFWHYQKLSQLDPGVKISYIILTSPRYFQPPQIIDDKVLFAFHIYLIRSIIILKLYAFILTLPKAIPTRPGGQNIVQYFDPPTRYFAFNVCISYLLDKIYHYIKIILMISLVIIVLLFDTTKNYPNSRSNIVRYFDWLPSNNQWQSFVCGSYLLYKIY